MKTYFTWIFLCFLPFCVKAQAGKGENFIKTWIDLNRDGEHLVINAFCENLADSDRELSFSLILTKTDANKNSSNSSQEGQINAEPQTPLRLAALKINETPGQSIMVILKISEMDSLVAVDSFKIAAVQPKTDDETEVSTPAATNEMGDSEDPDFGIGGLVLDETRSKVGAAFYEKFYALWQVPPGADDFILKIVEMPPRGRASQVQVFFDDQLVFNQFLQPGEEMIEDAVQIAIARANYFLQNYEAMQQNLDGEEKMGNGIY